MGARVVGPREVGVALYGPYAIGVELASTLLLAALIGARHLGQRHREPDPGLRQTAAAGATGGLAGGAAGGAATNAADVAAVQGEAAARRGDPGRGFRFGSRACRSRARPSRARLARGRRQANDTRFWRKDDD